MADIVKIITTNKKGVDMSKADEIFVQNMKDIMDNGVWDTNLPVRPKWSDEIGRAHV